MCVTQDMIQATNAHGQQSWSGADALQPGVGLPLLASDTSRTAAGDPFAVSAATNASDMQMPSVQEVNKKKRGRGGAQPEPEGDFGGAAQGPTQPATGTRSSRRVARRDPVAQASDGEGNTGAAALGAAGTTGTGAPAPEEEAAAAPAAAKRPRHVLQTVFTRDEAVAAFAADATWDEVGQRFPGLIRICKCCSSKKTTQWRMGPGGPKTLCNACGVRWSNDSKTAANAALNWPGLPRR